MNFQKFIDFVSSKLDILEIDDIKYIINWRYNTLFQSLNERYQKEEDKNIKTSLEEIILFLYNFLEDYKNSSYKYNYEECTDFADYLYWIDFYVKNKLISYAKNVIKDMQKKFPKREYEILRLNKKIERLDTKYKKESKKTEQIIKKNNKLKQIESMIWQWEYGQAMYECLQFIQDYPDDTKVKWYIKKIDELKASHAVDKINIWKDFFEKVWLLNISKKDELKKTDLKEVYTKLRNLRKIRDYEAWIILVKYIRDKHKIDDPNLLKYYNSFIEIKSKDKQKSQDSEYKLELKSLKLLYKNKQLQNAMNKANSILKKYPLVNKKEIFQIINKINKYKATVLKSQNKSWFEVWFEDFMMRISRFTPRELFFFYEKMSWFLKAKMDLKMSLQIIYYQAKQLSVKKFVRSILEWVDSGMKISEVLRWYHQISRLEVSLIKIWETTWKMWEMFECIYTAKREEEDRRKKIKSVMMYPAIVLSITVLIFLWLLIFIMPKFIWFYGQMNMELPAITRVMLWISAFIREKWYLVIWICAGVYSLWRLFWFTKVWKLFRSWIVLKLPVVSLLVNRKYVIYFASNLSLLLRSWINLLEALDLIIYWADNVLYMEEFKRIRFELESWISFARSVWLWNLEDVWQYTNSYIPIDLAYAVDIWEKTWQLSSLMGDVAQRYDDDLKVVIKNLQNMLEPFIIVLLWFAVVIFVAAVFLPLMNMYNVVWKMGWI